MSEARSLLRAILPVLLQMLIEVFGDPGTLKDPVLEKGDPTPGPCLIMALDCPYPDDMP